MKKCRIVPRVRRPDQKLCGSGAKGIGSLQRRRSLATLWTKICTTVWPESDREINRGAKASTRCKMWRQAQELVRVPKLLAGAVDLNTQGFVIWGDDVGCAGCCVERVQLSCCSSMNFRYSCRLAVASFV